MKWIKYLALTAIVFCSETLFAYSKSEPLRIGVSEITALLATPDKPPGAYNKVLKEFSDLDLYFASPARVDLLFEKQDVDCLFPASTATIPNPDSFISSKPINITKAYIFSLTTYQSIQEFEGKRLAIRRGLSIGNIRKKFNAQYINIDSDTALIKFLHKNRTDGIIAYIADINSAYKALELPLDYYNQENPIHASLDAFVCHKTEINDKKMKEINKKIKELSSSGKLSSLLKSVK